MILRSMYSFVLFRRKYEGMDTECLTRRYEVSDRTPHTQGLLAPPTGSGSVKKRAHDCARRNDQGLRIDTPVEPAHLLPSGIRLPQSPVLLYTMVRSARTKPLFSYTRRKDAVTREILDIIGKSRHRRHQAPTRASVKPCWLVTCGNRAKPTDGAGTCSRRAFLGPFRRSCRP